MGTDTLMVALDSNAMTYWLSAMASVTEPPTNPLSDEKIALARIRFWMPSESCFHITPTVEVEYERIKDSEKLANHRSWASTLISEVRPLPNPDDVNVRTKELLRQHKGERDCRILAECELTEIETLLTCDTDMAKKLKSAGRVNVCLPSEYWTSMRIAPDAPPTTFPAPGNSLANAAWWHLR